MNKKLYYKEEKSISLFKLFFAWASMFIFIGAMISGTYLLEGKTRSETETMFWEKLHGEPREDVKCQLLEFDCQENTLSKGFAMSLVGLILIFTSIGFLIGESFPFIGPLGILIIPFYLAWIFDYLFDLKLYSKLWIMIKEKLKEVNDDEV